MIHALVAAATHIGLIRPTHQDSLHLNGWTASTSGASLQMNLQGSGVLAVIDGMGGQQGGEMASRVASLAIADLKLATASSPAEVDQIIQKVSDTVQEMGARTAGCASMGATIAGIVLHEDSAIVFNVGDSSIMRIRAGNLGQLAVIDRATHEGSRKSAVTQALGGTPNPTAIDAHADTYIPGQNDLVVLCTDGLTDCIGSDAILQLASRYPDPAALVEQLISAACQAGAPDNISVIVLAFTTDAESETL